MPARTPRSDKILKGTDQPCRRPRPVYEPLTEVPDPPDYLSESAVPEWHRVAGVATAIGIAETDIRALAMLSETLATEAHLRAAIEQDGITIEAGSGGRKAHPGLAALAQARQQAGNLLAAFGLTPKGRQALPEPKGTRKPWDRNQFGYRDDGSNPFDQF